MSEISHIVQVRLQKMLESPRFAHDDRVTEEEMGIQQLVKR
jgi:hypothetical protein